MTNEEDRPTVIVVIEWVLFTLFCALMVWLWSTLQGQIKDAFTEGNGSLLQVVVIVLAVYFVISLSLCILLTVGFYKENRVACKTWYVINMVLVVLYALDIIYALASLSLLAIPFKVAILAYRIHAIRTIKAYVESLSSSTPAEFVCKDANKAMTQNDPNQPPYSHADV